MGALSWTGQASAYAEPVAAATQGIRVDVVANPAHLVAGQPTTLQYRLVYTDTGAPVTDLEIDHERIMHVLLISTDLADFQHVHPAEVAPGVYEVAFTPAVDSHYMAYATFRRGREDLEDMRHLAVHSGQLLEAEPGRGPAPKTSAVCEVEPAPPAEIRANEPALFRIRVAAGRQWRGRSGSGALPRGGGARWR